jgi:hypothetical protein
MSRFRNSLFVLRRFLREDLRTKLFYLRERLVQPRAEFTRDVAQDEDHNEEVERIDRPANKAGEDDVIVLSSTGHALLRTLPTIDTVLGLPNTRRFSLSSRLADSKKNNSQLLGSPVAGMDPRGGRAEQAHHQALARRDRLRERHVELS